MNHWILIALKLLLLTIGQTLAITFLFHGIVYIDDPPLKFCVFLWMQFLMLWVIVDILAPVFAHRTRIQ